MYKRVNLELFQLNQAKRETARDTTGKIYGPFRTWSPQLLRFVESLKCFFLKTVMDCFGQFERMYVCIADACNYAKQRFCINFAQIFLSHVGLFKRSLSNISFAAAVTILHLKYWCVDCFYSRTQDRIENPYACQVYTAEAEHWVWKLCKLMSKVQTRVRDGFTQHELKQRNFKKQLIDDTS